MIKNTNQKKKGFTLIELLAVILIIGILFAVFVPRIDFAHTSAQEAGLKSDFRSFSLAAEQMMREHAEFGYMSSAEVIARINQYLDPALQFNASGTSTGKDPWGQPYVLQFANLSATNNGGVMIISGGKDAAANGRRDYVIGTVYLDGVVSSATFGFSTNITSSAIGDIRAGGGMDISLDSGSVEMTYGI